VTLYEKSAPGGSGERELRGCIGTHVAQEPLYSLVERMAAASGFDDPRFPPLSEADIKGIEVEISVYLTGIEPIASIDEFVVGTHGSSCGRAHAPRPFSPGAVEEGWDKKTTLEYLCMKAGLPTDAWKDADARFSVYQTQIFGEQ